MTSPYQAPSTATPTSRLAPDTAVTRLSVPGELYAVQPGEGHGDAILCRFDLANADLAMSEPVATAWSNPGLVLAEYGLEPARDLADELLREVFGADNAAMTVAVERNLETQSPELVFRLEIARAVRDRRDQFLDRYVRDVDLPDAAPVPVLLWAYRDVD